ncbi:response regulator transcription factor [Nocardioides anomalus]|uniref:Response regulator transcription factor n=1 Tax=Nocardioides anomalus TaxID=2712223 RepID=A0A6G6WEA2_9ACTN|nr:response regulator transcription factor [Nocardioides anomalus]QIG43370.1 response regulator transcription factor [Nocardioides anomalus]
MRVAVVSRSHVVRAGLVSLIAQLQARAVVTEAVSLDGFLADYDVAIYDLEPADHDLASRRDVRGMVAGHTQVVGLVYDEARHGGELSIGEATIPLISLAVTPAQLLALLAAVMARGRHADRRNRRLPGELTEREFRVLELIGAGLTNEAIAKELYLSVNTVKTYVRTAYRKLDVPDRAQAMLWALEHGLAGGPERS